MIEPINETTFRLKMAEDEVEIGDINAAEFIPHAKLKRWGEECHLCVKPAGDIEEVEFEVEQDKVKSKYKVKQEGFELELESEFYAFPPDAQNELGAFEFNIILNKKPPTNRLVFDIETQGLTSYYQPPLTPEETADGVIRPDNVVGSYAVYHATRGNMHASQEDAERYKCGKGFHIYRPKLTDDIGNGAWADLDISNGVLTVTLPQGFLDSAVYPVSIDPNFGYETGGGSEYAINADRLYGSLFTSPADAETATSLTFYVKHTAGCNFKGVIVLHSNLNILTNGVGNPVAVQALDWYTSTFATSPALSPSTGYVLMFIPDGNANYRCDAGDPDQEHDDTTNSYASPTNPTDIAHYAYKISVYCTYTATGVEANIPAIMAHYRRMREA